MALSIPYRCAGCGDLLPLADVNVAQDLALCRLCGYTGPFLGAGMVPRLTDEELAHPPKGVRLERGFGDALTIVCHPQKKALWFLIPFTALWSGLSVAGIYGSQLAQGRFDAKLSLIGLPFLLGTAGLVAAILFNFFGQTTVTLSKGRVRVFMGLFGMGRTREMACGKGTAVAIQTSSYRVNNVPQLEIMLTDGGQEFKFGAMGLSSEAKKYVAAMLRRATSGG